MLGLGSSLAKGGVSLLTYVKDNLKLYLDFKSNKSDTLKFPCEGSTSFNGTNQQIELSDAGFPSGNSPFTISCWFNKTASVSYAALVSWGTASNNNANYLNLDNANHVKAGFYSNDLENGSGTDTSAGTWYHATVTYDGTTRRIYVNGSEEVNDTPSSVNVTLGGTLYIGTFFGTYDFNGKIANVGVWSRALSVEEINSVMRKNYSQLGSVEKTSLVMWQSLDSTSEKALALDGTGDFVQASLSSNTIGQTYSFWWSTTNTGINNWIFALKEDSTYRARFYQDYAYQFRVGTQADANYVYVGASGNSTGVYTTGKWHHILVYIDNTIGNSKVYVNGVSLTISGASGSSSVGTSNTLVIGNKAGNINQFAVWDGDKTSNASAIYALGVNSTWTDSYSTDMLGYWKLNTASTSSNAVIDLSGNSVHGTVNGNPTLTHIPLDSTTNNNDGGLIGAATTTSVYGGNAPVLPRAVDVAREGEADAIGNGSALFNGSSDYISLDHYSLSPSGTNTILFWFKTGVDDNGAVYTNVDGTANYISIGMWDGHIQMNCADTGGTDRRTTGTYNDNEWHHAALIKKDTSTCSAIYIDGILVGQDTSNTWAGANSRDEHVIGRAQYTSTEYYWGRGSGDSYLSQLGVWKGELTQAQIQSVMESTSYDKIPADVKSTLGVEKVTLLSNWTGSDYTSTITASTNTVNLEADTSSVNATKYLSGAGGIVTGTTNLSAGLYKISFDASWDNAPSTKILTWYSDGSTSTNETIASGSNLFYKVVDTANANSQFNIQMNNANQGITLSNISIKEVTNDLVGYWALDADNSANGVTNDVTTGEVLGVEKVTLLSNWTGSGYTSTIIASTNTIKLEADDSSVDASRYLSGAGGILTGTTNLSAGLYKISFDASWDNAPGVAKEFIWNDGSTPTTDTIASGSNIFYRVIDTPNGNSRFNIQMNNANQGITLANLTIKEVTSNTGVLK